jgi:ribosome-binding factor A
MKQHRLARVAEVIREVASEVILFELRDPRIKFTTVTRAEVSADLQHAKIYVTIMAPERDQKLTLHGLKSASGFIQSKLGERMKSRYVPVIQFILDEGQKNSMEVARLLNEEKMLQAEKQSDEVAEDGDTDERDEEEAAK